MAFPDDLLGIFFGPLNWEQRLAPVMLLKSPDGNEFTTYWRKNQRQIDKKLGIYFYPKVDGNVVDDLGINSARMPITMYFEGKNHDLESRAFMAALKERGVWEVYHPLYGFFDLQPVSVTENIDPTDSGNITALDVEWIEPIDPDTLETGRELAGIVDALSNDLNLSALDQFIDAVNQASAAAQNAIVTTAQGISNLSATALGPVAALSDAAFATQNAIQSAINTTLAATVLQVDNLGNQIQSLIQAPMFTTSDANARLNSYSGHTEAMFSLLPGGENQAIPNGASPAEVKNNAASAELSLNAGFVGFAQTAVTSTSLKTRAQALEAAQRLADNFDLVQSTLEQLQVDTQDLDIDEQYFAQSQSFSTAALLTSKAIQYLQRLAFDLKVERRIILDRPRAPVEIAVTEYGGFGENDSNIELFIESNDLHGEDILLLPAGREVVIYA